MYKKCDYIGTIAKKNCQRHQYPHITTPYFFALRAFFGTVGILAFLVPFLVPFLVFFVFFLPLDLKG